MSAEVFRWLQPFAVTIEGAPNCDPKQARPVLAVQESGPADPWRVRLVAIVVDDEGRLARVDLDSCQIGGVGSWSQLMLLSERSRKIQAPAVTAPPNLRKV